MNLFKHRKGFSFNMGVIYTMIGALVGLIVLFNVAAETVPEVQTAGDTLNATGVPLGDLFASTGVVPLIIMASLLLVVIGGLLYARRRR